MFIATTSNNFRAGRKGFCKNTKIGIKKEKKIREKRY
jgi:hypothetical protein